MATDISVIVSPAQIATAVTLATGAPGANGAAGSDASVTSANITSALGYTPDSPTSTRPPASHTHPLSQITQSGATSGQVPSWNGTAWVPATPTTGNSFDQSLNTTDSPSFSALSVGPASSGAGITIGTSNGLFALDVTEELAQDRGLGQTVHLAQDGVNGGDNPFGVTWRLDSEAVAGGGFYGENWSLNKSGIFGNANEGGLSFPWQFTTTGISVDRTNGDGGQFSLNEYGIAGRYQDENGNFVVWSLNPANLPASYFSGSYADLTGTPSTFAPSAHASSHASGGSDALTLASSQITGLASVATSGSASDIGSGTLADARLSSNVPLDNQNNNFTAGQSITAPANTSALTASYSVTGANTTPLLDLSGTWNTSGVARGILLNITDTASAASSLLMDLRVNGSSRVQITKAGTFLPSGNIAAPSGNYIGFASADCQLFRDAANTLALRNGTNAQTARIYNTYTDASNYERGFMRWNSNVLEIGTEAGGTGSNRAVQIHSAGAARVIFTSGAAQFNTSVQINSGSNLRLIGSATPASATATGTTGDIQRDADYIYVCTATNTWKRVALSTW